MGWISPFRLRLAVWHLRLGGLVAYPTEAVYGLGCDPLNPKAVAKLLALKQRSATKGLILIAADFRQIETFMKLTEPAIREKLVASWPGPMTWIVPASPWVPSWLRGEKGDIAVRVTSHGPAAALCRAFGGPIISTSANPSGAPPARTRIKTRRYFPGANLTYVPGATGGLRRPTAIYDAHSGMQLR
jgi:L-threonylcarbamoyladenylate synthase